MLYSPDVAVFALFVHHEHMNYEAPTRLATRRLHKQASIDVFVQQVPSVAQDVNHSMTMEAIRGECLAIRPRPTRSKGAKIVLQRSRTIPGEK